MAVGCAIFWWRVAINERDAFARRGWGVKLPLPHEGVEKRILY